MSGSGLPDGAEFVLLALKKVGIDRARCNAAFAGQLFYVGNIFESVGQVPEHVQGDVGHAPVNWLTMPASLNFSAMLVAAAGCTNLPKRVPVLAKPQDGNSILNRSSACQTEPSMSCATVSPIRVQQGNSLYPQLTSVNQPGGDLVREPEAYCTVSVRVSVRVCVPDTPDSVSVEVAGAVPPEDESLPDPPPPPVVEFPPPPQELKNRSKTKQSRLRKASAAYSRQCM